jgi:uncharacterized membrane protein
MENIKNNAKLLIKGLAILSFIVFIATALYLIGVASGNISSSDDSTLGHVVFFLIHRPFIVIAMVVLIISGYVIASKEEKKLKETGCERPLTKVENKFYNFWDKALSDRR